MSDDEQIATLLHEITDGCQALAPDSCDEVRMNANVDLSTNTIDSRAFALGASGMELELVEDNEIEDNIGAAATDLVRLIGYGCSGFELRVPLGGGEAELVPKF